MFAYIWPVALIVISNILYHISCKSTPPALNPFLALTVTYFLGAVVSAVLYFVIYRGGNISKDIAGINWVPFVLGLAVVGLEAGYIFAYKVGWPVSTAQITQSALVAVALLLFGVLFFRESITWTKVSGIIVCMIGLYLLRC